MMTMNNQYSAASLYDGGWRAEDRDQLIEEYNLTEEEADEICRGLAEVEEEATAKDKEQALMELADEMNEMIALGWEEEEAHEDEDAFLRRLGDYAEGLTLEEIWQTWKNVWEIRKEV